jgi:hypothetical protein
MGGADCDDGNRDRREEGADVSANDAVADAGSSAALTSEMPELTSASVESPNVWCASTYDSSEAVCGVFAAKALCSSSSYSCGESCEKSFPR